MESFPSKKAFLLLSVAIDLGVCMGPYLLNDLGGFVVGIAFMAILWHGINFLLVLFTTFGRNVIHESQGRRLCESSLLSLFIALYLLINPSKEYNNSTFQMCFAVLLMFVLTFCQQLGIQEILVFLSRFVAIVLWLIYFAGNAFEWQPIGIFLVVLTFAGLLVNENLQEHENQRTFLKLDASSIGSHGLFSEVSPSLLFQQPLADKNDPLYGNRANLSQHAANLLENRREIMMNSVYTEFNFENVCKDIFAGHGLTLYVESRSPEIMLTTPYRMIFELIIFLIVNESVKGKCK
eukprot:gene33535-43337_t